VGLAAVAGALASVQRPLGQGQFGWDRESVFCGPLQTSPIPGLWTVARAAPAGTALTGAFLPPAAGGTQEGRAVRAGGGRPQGSAAMYGMLGSLPDRTMVNHALVDFMDGLDA